VISGATRESQEQAEAPGKNKFSSDISQFDDRQNARSMTLFAIVRPVFGSTAAVAKTIDMTAFEPTPAHALNVAST
jgi:hypothetical protein